MFGTYARPLHGWTGVCFLLLGLGCAGEPPAATPPVNVVVLCIDTLRVDHVSGYGHFRETTPRLDALAAGGTLFEDAVAQSSWTVPATATLLTSLYPYEHGALVEGGVKNLSEEMPPSQLRKGVSTLGELFSDAGFHTGLFSANPFLYGRFKEGFDAAEVERQSATELNEKALDWLRGVEAEPFFLYIQYMDLHQPIEPPEPYFSYFGTEDAMPGPEHVDWSFGQQEDLEDPAFLRYRDAKIALYDGALRYVDAEIGRLLDVLAELGHGEDTLVVVTSDHGEEFWDHAAIERRLGGDPRGIWGVGHGHSMFAELLDVPLILAGPGIAAGRRVDCPVRHLDVAPSLLRLVGIEPLQEMRGEDLEPYFRASGDAEECRDVPILFESPAYGPGTRGVVWKGRKLILRDDGVALLYDLRSDPQERDDLADRQSELRAGLESILEAERASSRSGLTGGEGGREMEFDEETRKQLEALGYLGN